MFFFYYYFCFSFRYESIINEPKAKKIKPKASKLISKSKNICIKKTINIKTKSKAKDEEERRNKRNCTTTAKYNTYYLKYENTTKANANAKTKYRNII